MPLTTTELQTLRAFFWTPEGKFFAQWLQQKLGETDVQLRSLSGEHLYRAQGRAQQLDELIRELSTADQVLKQQAPSKAPTVRDWTQP